jgi:hypothetical protein
MEENAVLDSELESIVIPSSVGAIGKGTVRECKSLASGMAVPVPRESSFLCRWLKCRNNNCDIGSFITLDLDEYQSLVFCQTRAFSTILKSPAVFTAITQ